MTQQIDKEILKSALKPADLKQYLSLRTMIAEGKVLNKFQQEKYDYYESLIEEYQRRKKENSFVMTTADVSRFYNKTVQAINLWQKLPDFPKAAKIRHGYFDLKILNDWVVERFYGSSKTSKSMAEAKLRRELAKAKREELLTQELEGKLISKEQVIEDLVVVFLALRQRFLSWIKRLPALLEGKDIKEMMLILKDETWDMLNELSKGLDNIKKLNELEDKNVSDVDKKEDRK
jgi:hypothetical protein